MEGVDSDNPQRKGMGGVGAVKHRKGLCQMQVQCLDKYTN